jgi:hypothetical protein
VGVESWTILAEVIEEGGDDAWLDSLAVSLAGQLHEYGVEARRPPRTTPERAKGSTVAVATLVISLAGSPVLATLAGVLVEWVRRARGRRLRLTAGNATFEISSATTEQQEQALSSFLKAYLPANDRTGGQ